MKFSFSILLLIFLGIVSSCDSQDDTTPSFSLSVPSSLGKFPIRTENPITQEGINLGRTLFFDPILSHNSRVSCSSCHFPKLAFSDGLTLSNTGISKKELIRHTPVLFNLAWHNGYFWDGGAHNLASQAFGPLTHTDEMGSNLNDVMQKLNESALYPILFQQAFPDEKITSKTLSFALEQYQLSLISGTSKYDDYLAGKNVLNTQELKGLKLFTKHCESCHQGNHFSDFSYHNNGLDSAFNYEGEDPRLGRYRITLNLDDLGKYKTPSLRNIELTAPYMHDGRFNNLEKVLTHYQHNIQLSNTVELKNLSFNDDEKAAIITFLYTLTDEKFITKHTQK